MSKRKPIALIGCVLVLGALGAQPAAAATQVGNGCEGTSPYPGTMVSFANAAGSPYPARVPTAGVVTRWTSNMPPELSPGIYGSRLKILRSTGAPKQFRVIGESEGILSGGLSTFPARIPVLAGDYLGSSGYVTVEPKSEFTIYCGAIVNGNLVLAGPGNPPVGSVFDAPVEGLGAQLPIVVTVEPDADDDGFGDETQDACPQSPTTQGTCLAVAVEAASVLKRKRSVVVLVTTDSPAPVTVAGSANVGKGKKVKVSSTPQVVVPGRVGRFTLNFPRRLRDRLKGLPRKRSLGLTVTVSATDLIGRVTSDTLATKLKGQRPAKPKQR